MDRRVDQLSVILESFAYRLELNAPLPVTIFPAVCGVQNI